VAHTIVRGPGDRNEGKGGVEGAMGGGAETLGETSSIMRQEFRRQEVDREKLVEERRKVVDSAASFEEGRTAIVLSARREEGGSQDDHCQIEQGRATGGGLGGKVRRGGHCT